MGLLVLKVGVRIHAGNDSLVEGEIHLDNACDMGTVQLNTRTIRRLGSPSTVRLFYEANESGAGDLFIEGA